MRDALIGLRVTTAKKNKLKRMARQQGFETLSAYLFWLIHQSLNKNPALSQA
jgi:hypothetical protein